MQRKRRSRQSRRKVKLIKELLADNNSYSLKDLLKISEVPKSTYCYESSKKDIDSTKNARIIDEITFIFDKDKQRYGVRRVTEELKNKGHTINHKKVQWLMHKLKLKARCPKEKYHSIYVVQRKLLR